MEEEEKKEQDEHHENHEKKEENQQKKQQAHEHNPEKRELRDSRISVLIFTLAGAAVALLSSILKSSGLSNYIIIALGFLVLVALIIGMQKAFRRKLKFFYAGLFVYLLAWLVFWIFLYNM